ncbi:SUF system Fe-S cluster assembly regulator [Paraburkholderia kururiensis]|uniref:SUF system Fe-S cluster assembly regulator n=1 Tax=Paraburkholderia kururiensis TaxID=984307 RepID=A0ABZ0WMS9_9BURK|nr:SUF system Fe-S cluster assembly regulator [Paraburkholderia kururiensis]WQD78682.1 SUF system Fe-S cluster assembly regulator [Paraburkholderia kururiensis]
MLRMSKLADYATVMLTVMARDPDTIQSAASLAAACGIPAPTVSKVMKILARGGMAVSLRGVSGGYLLPRAADRITLADIITAVDGPFGMTECSAVPGQCEQEAMCGARANWQRINRVIFEALRQVSLADMAGPALRAVDISAIRARGVPRPSSAAPAVTSRTARIAAKAPRKATARTQPE